MSEPVVEILKAVLTFITGAGAMLGGIYATKRNSKVAEEDNKDRAMTEQFKAVNEAWEKLNKPLVEQVDGLTHRVAAVEAANRELRAENERLHRERQELERKVKAQQDAVTKAVELLLQYVEWLDTGAVPPQPVKLPDVIRHLKIVLKGL